MWFPPEHSVLVEVTGHALTTCESFDAGVTLRFPRVIKIRYDKHWYECARLVNWFVSRTLLRSNS